MISKRQAAAILKDAELPEGRTSSHWKYAAAPKETRRELIRRKPESEEARICASIEIQRVYRGYCTRCLLLKNLQPQLSQTAVYKPSQMELLRLNDVRTPTPVATLGKHGEGREHLESMYKAYLAEMAGLPGGKISFEDFCAKIIQQSWRGHTERRKSGGIQGPLGSQKRRHDKPLTETEAAIIIQRAWRRHIDVQVFRYYKDLINFRNHGDPSMMLRCINPAEAKMLDAAAGIHIKFRLAGDRFPPNIYYKIFTHRPVQDLCANAPRDYTNWKTKRMMARDVHNKGDRLPSTDMSDWYKRVENNGWRMVSDRLIHHQMSDPVTWDTSQKKVEFHHNKMQRKQDVEKKKKRRKIEWMQKMYKEGMLQAKTDDSETRELIEGAAAGMVATVEAHGCDAVQEWEVDELLDWTTNLNFDDYITTWAEMATSAASEKQIYERFKLYTSSTSDPYEFSLSTESPSKPNGSTRQSHNTPVSAQSIASY